MIDALQIGAFLGSHFDAYRADFRQALRDIATDPDESIRKSALGLLSLQKDAFAQALLIQGLQDPATALVSEVIALQFLSHDDHASTVGIARDVLNRPSSPAARLQAIRLLASDPQAQSLLTSLMTDKGELSAIRRASAISLRAVDPQAFILVARLIVADESDFPEIRTTSRNQLALLGENVDVRSKRLGASSRSRRAARPPPTSKG